MNTDIREATRAANVKLWQVAEALGMRDTAFSRLMRHELPTDQKDRIRDILQIMIKESDHHG